MEAVLVLLVALTFPGANPTEYRPVRTFSAKGELLAASKGFCENNVKALKAQGITATCELMTYNTMAALANNIKTGG